MSRIIPALLATLAIAIGASGLVALGIGLFGAYGPWAPLFVVVPILGFGLFLLALQRLRFAVKPSRSWCLES